MVQAAKLYYDLERTQSEIARELGLTRWQVSRLIREARELGIVRIEIAPRSQRRPDLEVRLQRTFELREAIVVSTAGAEDEGIAMETVARAAAKYLASINPPIRLIGVSWGRTMAAIAHALPAGWNDGIQVVLVNGAANLRSSVVQTNMVAELFAQAGNGLATLLPVPAIVGKRSTREILEQDPVVAKVMELAAEAPVICFGMGALSADSVLVGSGYIDPDDIARLGGRGAVGDVLGRFITADGSIADPDLDARTLGLRLEALRTKERAVGVSSGRSKHAIALSALKSGYANVFITDEETALHVLGD
ncbi:deoxyribonucleoside regulator [Faunimonas pinastri]|uniref:Deoxyribonucleoside regulator n=2 Tax=Faunimonas pinastri TaxID=1855383 RepID=A0A1H9EUB3_9HYPH|nr:deoxyribonucleoside regulator [Faunimonas pinastri]